MRKSGEIVRKTFDDEYGRHALIYPNTDRDSTPEYGRVDVLRLIGSDGVIANRLHPTRLDTRTPAHAKPTPSQGLSQ
jgi:hypothetical protein